MQHIFYSWQADTPTATGKNLIGRALQDAIDTLNADAEIEGANRTDDPEAAVLDHDTVGEPGSPPIVETIFRKIDCAAVFVSDLTYVAEREDGRRSPNPNVLLEHGWAWKSRSWRAVFSVMNIAHGHPKDYPLPFDLQHSKGPIFFDCPDNATPEQRRAARAALAKALVPRLRAILDDDILKAERVPAAPAEPHPHDLELAKRWQVMLTEPVRLFLREHNFGDVYLRKRVEGLHEINDTWQGAKFEFDDPELQRVFQAFLTANRDFCRKLFERTYVLDANIDMAGPKTVIDQRQGMQQSTLATINELNALGTQLTKTIDDFDRTLRARIRTPIDTPVTPPPARGDDPRIAKATDTLAALAADRVKGGIPRLVSRPCLTIRIAPLSAFEARRLEPAAVAKAQLHFPPSLDVRVEEGSDARQWWVCGVPAKTSGPNPETGWLARLIRPGLIEAEATIGARIDDDREIVVDGRQLEREIVTWSERLAATLPSLGRDGPALVHFMLDGVEDVVLQRARPGGRRIGTPHLHLATLLVDDVAAPIAPSLHEAFDILWQAAGWRDGSPSYGSGIWSGYGPTPSAAGGG